MEKFNRRYLFYGISFLALFILALWVFYKPSHLDELRRMERVEQGTEEPLETVKKALEEIRKRDWGKLYALMLEWDRSDFEEMYVKGLFLREEFHPAEPTGCARLIHSHRPDNISVFVFSEPRNETYQFSLRRDRQGKYKIRNISLTE